jgi:hypothetical protein
MIPGDIASKKAMVIENIRIISTRVFEAVAVGDSVSSAGINSYCGSSLIVFPEQALPGSCICGKISHGIALVVVQDDKGGSIWIIDYPQNFTALTVMTTGYSGSFAPRSRGPISSAASP